MNTHNICFCGEIRKVSILLDRKKHLIKSYGLMACVDSQGKGHLVHPAM